jgi:hypothetical protein
MGSRDRLNSMPTHTFRHIVVAASALLALLVLVGATQAGRPHEWLGDFESANLSQWDAVQETVDGRVSIEHTVVRQGRYAARFEVKPGDHWAGLAGERAEVLKGVGEVAGDESYWAWSTYFPASFVSDHTSGFQMFTQWHSSSNTNTSGVTFQVVGERLVVRVEGGATSDQWHQYDLGPLVRSAWQDFVVHVRWGSGNDGFLDVWRDGKLMVSHAVGPNIGTGLGTYVKQGFYRPSTSTTTVVYADAMRYGADIEDVTTPFALGIVGRTTISKGRVWFQLKSFADVGITATLADRTGKAVSTRELTTDGRGRAWSSVACRGACSSLQRPLRLVVQAGVDPGLPQALRFAQITIG